LTVGRVAHQSGLRRILAEIGVVGRSELRRILAEIGVVGRSDATPGAL
jgi:hypothetical protein